LAEHDRWLRTVVGARLGERQGVDEVMQEVALAALAQREATSEPARLGPWLYRIAVRQVLLHRRRCGRRRKLVDRYARLCDDPGGSSVPDPLDWLLLDERRQAVREALGRLPRRDAEILLLKYTEGWSYRQLAEQLGTAESTVESRLHRARRKLREAMARANVNEGSAR
jgi:RNA polymerase sigma-70 factor (ECF subfamily)